MILGATAAPAGVLSVLCWWLLRGWFADPRRCATNVRGKAVPVGVGVTLVPAAVLAASATAQLAGHHPKHLSLAALVATGFAALGLADDWFGSAAVKGFRGHVRALVRRRPTTGSAKLIGGGMLSLVAVWSLGRSAGETLAGAALVALAANAANLFDRAPGRLGKVSLAAGAALLAGSGTQHADELLIAAGLLGGVAGLLPFDLRERLMLGDAGANALGASLGLGVVLTASFTGQLAVLALLASCNLAGEVVSFSRVIERSAPLRAIDLWGRERAGHG